MSRRVIAIIVAVSASALVLLGVLIALVVAVLSPPPLGSASPTR